jgi:8-oxo-dGTP pyrophosphatase MutT (NUDIX family)
VSSPVARRSCRVIAIDPDGRFLLLGGRYEGRRIWITPGGGCWPDEDDMTTASRELLEETGLRVEPERLGRIVATTAGIWTGADGTLYDSIDNHFAVRVDGFEPTRDGHEDLEREWIEEFRWWTLDELVNTRETVWPLGLAGVIERLLAGDWPTEPVKLPWHHADD